MLHGLGPSYEVRSNVEAKVNHPTTKGTDFLDIVKLLLTVLCAFYLLFIYEIVHVESNDPFALFRNLIGLFISIIRLVSRIY